VPARLVPAAARDHLMADPPLWLQSLICCELALQLPFFVVALVALATGRERDVKTGFRVYAAHVSTTLVPILAHLVLGAPQGTPWAVRLRLVLIYAPYLLVPLSLFVAFKDD